MNWQPIETYELPPFVKDSWFISGDRVLVWIGHVSIAQYGYTKRGKGRWWGVLGNCNPTHWMPLPEPPK